MIANFRDRSQYLTEQPIFILERTKIFLTELSSSGVTQRDVKPFPIWKTAAIYPLTPFFWVYASMILHLVLR